MMAKKVLPTPKDKEPYKMLYMELGATEAATRSQVPLGSMTKWASRYGWCDMRAVPLKRGQPQKNVSHYVATPSEALKEAHSDLATRAKSALAQATVAAAEQAAADPALPVRSTSHLRDLAGAAAQLFGWGDKGVTVNAQQALVVTQEQLEQIRALRGT